MTQRIFHPSARPPELEPDDAVGDADDTLISLTLASTPPPPGVFRSWGRMLVCMAGASLCAGGCYRLFAWAAWGGG